MKDYIVMVQDLLNGRNEEFDNADTRRIRLIRHADNRKEKIIDGKSYANSLYNFNSRNLELVCVPSPCFFVCFSIVLFL